MFTNINSSSPLKHDYPMLDGAMRLARRGQPVFVTPFTLSGAMAPVTLAGAVMQQTAEALAAIVLLQLIRPGTPVVYGCFTSNVDMKSGAPAFGTPEYIRATRFPVSWPVSTGCRCAHPMPALRTHLMLRRQESAFSLWACVSSRTNVVYHAAGWLEGGLCASYEKFVMDCDTLQQISHYMKGVSATEADLAFDAIKEVGPRGHFFGTDTRKSAMKRLFTIRLSATGATSKPGKRRAQKRRPSEPTVCGRRF